MNTIETKNQKFRRLAKTRGDNLLRDIHILGNLSNRNNYEYSEHEVRAIFSAIEDELKVAKQKFGSTGKRKISL